MQTGIPLDVLETYDWETLATYQDVIHELNPEEKPADGAQALMSQAQKYGG